MTFLRSLFALLALLCWSPAWAAQPGLPPPEPGKLTVYFLDVGQGDAALIVSPTGKTILVDAGPPEAGAALVQRVKTVTKGPLDLALLSHPHLDHLGGLTKVVQQLGARRYLDPGYDHPSTAYRDLLKLIANREIEYIEPTVDEHGAPWVLGIGGGAALTFLWPRRPAEPFIAGSRSDANANSLVFRLTHGETSLLFTGDAEAQTEAQLLRMNALEPVTLLKVAHHGSRHSSQPPFIAKVKPEVAIVSCGRGNEYGHPHGKALTRFEDQGTKVLRTDLLGDVRVVSDGKTLTVDVAVSEGVRRVLGVFKAAAAPPSQAEKAQQESATVRFAASRRSEVFHRADCEAVGRIAPKNLVKFEERSAAAQTRRPAGDCHP